MLALLDRRPLLVALAAGLIAATGFAPLELWPLLVAGFAVWLGLVHRAPTLRAAMARSWTFGVGHFALGSNWMQHAFDFQDKMPPVLGYVAVILVGVYLAVFPALAGGLVWRWGRRDSPPDLSLALIAGAAWIATEWLRGHLFTGYPWNPLAAALVPLDGLAGLAAWTGTYALSGLVVVAAGCLLLGLHRQWVPLASATAAILLLAAIGNGEPPAPRADRLVRVVQPNIGQDAVFAPDYDARVFEAMLGLSGTPGTKPRLLVWPEGLVNYLIEDGYPAPYYWKGDPREIRARIAARLGARDIALVGGNAAFFEGQRLTGAGNSVFVVTPQATLGPRYDKAHLVPFGEYLPLRTLLAPIGLARLVMGEIDFIPGPGPRTLPIPGFGKGGMQICYEIVFSGAVVDRANRPDFIFNPSNDAWFGSWGPPQHLAQARLRAIEEGLPVLRATPTGISAVIAADGTLIATIPPNRAAAIEVAMPATRPPTLFARAGNWLALVMALLLVAGAVAFRRVTR